MRKLLELRWIVAILFFASAAFGQISQPNYLTYKSLIFPQLAAGGQYQTWITVTNRGSQPWAGTFNFYTGNGLAWNPYVNGAQISGGALAVQIDSKATNTFKVTLPGTQASDTEAGFLIANTNDVNLDNFLEGNLTYYVSWGGPILDSVGIMPSRPFFASVIPFEDFSTLCFAFANTDLNGSTANIKMTLFSDTNVQVGSSITKTLDNMEHVAEYLWQTFPTASNTSWRGRVEIESDVPISGVALTQAVGQQLSSLPLDSTTRSYSVQSTGTTYQLSKVTLWSEGPFVNGYLTLSGVSDLFAITGQILDTGSLHLHFDGKISGAGSLGISGYIATYGTYAPGQTTVTGFYDILIVSLSSVQSGTFTATLIP